jgi:DNA-binding NarL/FixJ family response regulator
LRGHFNISQASSAAAAMQTLEESPIDIVCTDVDMPGTMDGLDLAEIVSRRWPQVAVLINSGRDMPERRIPPRSVFFAKAAGFGKLVAALFRLADFSLAASGSGRCPQDRHFVAR